jgi:hypothetical protein
MRDSGKATGSVTTMVSHALLVEYNPGGYTNLPGVGCFTNLFTAEASIQNAILAEKLQNSLS